MRFQDWQQLTPVDAAREVHRRARSLSPAQQRAVFAKLADETTLAQALASAPSGSPLRGVPFLVKDLFPVAGEAMLAGSTFLPEVRPAAKADSTLVAALRTAGAALAGRTHLHEFAYGITGENPHYGDCEHPRFAGRTTGGSSSGSAAAVAAGVVPLALGSDTGGSVRVPAAFCGLFGFRATPRDRWIADAFPLAPSFDTAGWFTSHASDLRATLDALIPGSPALTTPRGGILELPGLDPDVRTAFTRAAAKFAAPVDVATREALLAPFTDALDSYNTLVAIEAWEIHRPWAERYRERYDPSVWQRLNRVHALTPDQRAAAEKSITRIRQAWSDYFRSNDFLILPASPCVALTKAECNLAHRTRLLNLTAPASIGGFPVLSLPVSLPSGLSTGLQIVVRTPDNAALRWALQQS